MKKITDFIINKRYFILVTFIIFSIISVILSNNVKINYDMAEYLPDTSETRIGMNIMQGEFDEIKSSSFRLMFNGLNDEEKSKVHEYLKSVNGVSSVDYDETEEYNKDSYTLYVINVEDSDDSKTATDVYSEITNHFKDYENYTAGDIADRNNPVLPSWIMVVAIGCAIIILIIMCESYVEPFLFLTAILMAVLLNNGTNIIFGTVSNITSSISAILQMALSMDYSIMLINRYRQEKEKEPDKVKAMKNALYNAFSSISSSSITTIVGLLALAFMSFKIGKDLGFVLAKGVLFSLVTIFFVLPALILMFDKWITRTKKKSPTIKLDGVGKISYKFRYVAVFLFIGAFIISYLLKGNLGIFYNEAESNEISKIFPENNQIAIIYKNEDEKAVSKHLEEIENIDKVNEALGYSNTINEKLQYDKLSEKMNELGADVTIDDYLLKIIYYNYFNQDENNTMTFNEFVTFIQDEVYKNDEISNQLDKETKSNINRLTNFTNITSINKKRSANEIANILGIDKNKVDDILIYYNSKNNNLKISLNDFISFMNKDVLANATYSKNIGTEARTSLNKLSKFTDKSTITKKMTSKEMANLFGMPEDTMNSLYTYYISINEINTKISISEFANFVLTDVVTNRQYASLFDETTVNNIKMLQTFSNKNIITKNIDSSELANLFGIDENMVKQLLMLKYGAKDNGTSLTIAEFINNVTYLKTNTNYLNDLDISGFENIDETILSNPTKYTATEMSKLLNIDSSKMYQIYSLIDFAQNNTNDWKVTPNDFVELILDNVDNESIKNSIDEATINKLKLLSNIMTSTMNNDTYTYKGLSEIIGIDANTVKNIYTLYVSNKTTTKLAVQEFVNFVLNHKEDSALSSNLNSSTISDLKLVKSVMEGVINNKKYSTQELSNLLGINADSLNLLYGLYNFKYVNINQSMSLKDFVNFILNDVITNNNYSSNFDEASKLELNTINGIMNACNNNTKYNKDEIFAILSNLTDNLDKNTVELLYIYYGSEKEYNNEWKLTIEEFVNYLNNNILNDNRFKDFLDDNMKQKIVDSKETVSEAKDLLVGDKYSRIIINTKLDIESDETFEFIQNIEDKLKNESVEFYIIGNSPMSYEMSKDFQGELNFITILTMVAIFIVVAITFKSIIIPVILVFTIQCAVYMTMGILSFSGDSVYFIALLIVQSILMGATIDYAILYTSYYIEHRKKMNIKESIINSYNKSINTILTSASILIIVTLIIGNFASAITAKICMTISNGTLCSAILILVLLPAILAACDKLIIKRKKVK